MLNGQGFCAEDYNPLVDAIPPQQLEATMAGLRQQIETYVQGLPPHRAFIEANCSAEAMAVRPAPARAALA